MRGRKVRSGFERSVAVAIAILTVGCSQSKIDQPDGSALLHPEPIPLTWRKTPENSLTWTSDQDDPSPMLARCWKAETGYSCIRITEVSGEAGSIFNAYRADVPVVPVTFDDLSHTYQSGYECLISKDAVGETLTGRGGVLSENSFMPDTTDGGRQWDDRYIEKFANANSVSVPNRQFNCSALARVIKVSLVAASTTNLRRSELFR